MRFGFGGCRIRELAGQALRLGAKWCIGLALSTFSTQARGGEGSNSWAHHIMNEGKDNTALARNIGLFALIIYGVGDMIGAGIYGTIGVAAGKMGNAVWLASCFP